MAFNQTKENIEVDISSWSYYLFIMSVVILVASFPLSLITFAGAVKAALKKEATLLEWVIALFCFATFQLCCFGQVGTLARIISHFREEINIHVSCLFSHLSTEFAVTVLHFGLFASIVVRWIYVVHPQTGKKINQRPRLFKFIVTTMITGFALSRCFTEYFSSKTSIYRFCVVDIVVSYRDILSTSNKYYTWMNVLIVITIDLIITARTWWSISLRSRQVHAARNNTGNHVSKVATLLTMQGTIFCRIAGTLAYFSFFFVRRFAPEESIPMRDHFLATTGQLIAFAALNILAPIAFIANSPFISSWLRIKQQPYRISS